jgi:diacylglycerol kinase (ATP)
MQKLKKMKKEEVHIVLNPVAGAGRALKMMPELAAILKQKNGHGADIHLTKDKNDTTEVTRRLIAEEAQLIVAAGGDGTLNDVLNGFFSDSSCEKPSVSLGIIRCGTGQGMALSLQIPVNLSEQVDLIFSDATRLLDIGRISYTGIDNQQATRYFISECQLGIGSMISKEVHHGSRFLNGKTAFAVASLHQALTYHSVPMVITVDGLSFTNNFIGLAIGNGSLTAGGMHVTPGAKPDDGEFNILLIHKMNLVRRLINLSKVYSGTHIKSSCFTYLKGKDIQIDSCQEVLVSIDGEVIGKTPCRISVIPSAVRIKSLYN